MSNSNTEQNKQEWNKLIAEFMGAINETGYFQVSTIGKTKVPTGRIYMTERFPNNMHLCSMGDLHYHTSWDWLMPVVEKIADLDYDFTISNKWCCIEGGIPDYFSDSIGTKKVTTLEIVWEQVTQFITWYNSLNTK